MKILVSIILSTVLATTIFALRPVTRIHLVKGKKEIASVIPAKTNKDYVVALKKGQKVIISVASPCKANILMEIHAANGTQLASGTQFFDGEIAKTGDVKVRVMNGSSVDSCKSTLKVNVK